MTKILNSLEHQLCDIQGRLFELSLKKRIIPMIKTLKDIEEVPL